MYDPKQSDVANICRALHSIAAALRDLGFGDRTPPGAIEGHTLRMQEEIRHIPDAIRDGFDRLADAIASKR